MKNSILLILLAAFTVVKSAAMTDSSGTQDIAMNYKTTTPFGDYINRNNIAMYPNPAIGKKRTFISIL